MNNILMIGILTILISGCKPSGEYKDYYDTYDSQNIMSHEAIILNKNLQLIIEELHIMNQAIREKK